MAAAAAIRAVYLKVVLSGALVATASGDKRWAAHVTEVQKRLPWNIRSSG